MNRRQILAGAPMLFTLACDCNNSALGAATIIGCRGAAAGLSQYRGRIRNRSQAGPHADMLLKFSAELKQRMQVHPDFYFYDDSEDGKNALAIPAAARTAGTDGTVLIGINLIRDWQQAGDALRGQSIWKDNNLSKVVEIFGAAKVIIAHELGHIVQYKRGMTPDGPWQMETHADFMAGWCLGMDEYFRDQVEGAANFIFSLGDTKFNDLEHHGEPVLRQAMVRAGYDSRALDINAAFAKGLEMAHLH